MLLQTYCGAVRVKAGRSERDDVVAARASGLRVRAMEAMAIVQSKAGIAEYKAKWRYGRQELDGIAEVRLRQPSRGAPGA